MAAWKIWGIIVSHLGDILSVVLVLAILSGRKEARATLGVGTMRARLGPPEEFRQPSPFDRARPTSPQRRRILEGGEVFIRDSYTYASERYRIETFGVPPVGPALFRVSWRSSREDRWRIEFDESDVVQTVSHVDESADDDR